MSRLAARFFTTVQQAPFYRDMLQEAVEQLPGGEGRTLLDAGCGPGLLARLAAAHGWRATGFDADPAMVKAARRIARHDGSNATFLLGRVPGPPAQIERADVVVAASLLAVTDDKQAVLHALWSLVLPAGALAVVEATGKMTVREADALIGRRELGAGSGMLRMWASSREGRSSIQTSTAPSPTSPTATSPPCSAAFRPLAHQPRRTGVESAARESALT